MIKIYDEKLIILFDTDLNASGKVALEEGREVRASDFSVSMKNIHKADNVFFVHDNSLKIIKCRGEIKNINKEASKSDGSSVNTECIDREELADAYNEDLLFMDGYDDCILGVCLRYGQDPIVAYSLDKVLSKLVEDGLTEEEALEFWEFNQVGAYAGETTPCFIKDIS